MKAVLFDLDGVITSERIYWNCSGLALAKFLGRKLPEKEAEKIKLAKSLLPDDVIRGFKENGVNSNWDIAYASSILVRAGKDVKDFLAELKRRNMKGVEYLKLLDEFDPSEKHDRDGGSWGEAHKRFQACYYELEDTDEPAIPLEKIKKSLDELKAMGLRLGIVSGRPLKEADKPLKKWGLWDYFDRRMIVMDDDVVAEGKRTGRHMGKPDPWPVLRAAEKGGLRPQDCVLVGDSVADILSGKSAGVRVICVKSGITTEAQLKAAGAEIVVDDLTKVPAEIKKLL